MRISKLIAVLIVGAIFLSLPLHTAATPTATATPLVTPTPLPNCQWWSGNDTLCAPSSHSAAGDVLEGGGASGVGTEQASSWVGPMKDQSVTTGSINAGVYANVTLTWTVAFADASYTAECSVLDSTSAAVGLTVDHVQALNAGTMVVTVHNGSAGALTGTLMCHAIHN